MDNYFFTNVYYNIYKEKLRRSIMNILKRINTLRMNRGWSIYKLSVESGIAQSTLINMFNRETLPSITTLENLCTAFGISMSEFFEDSSDASIPSKKKEFIETYEALSPQTRQAVLNLMKDLAK